MMQNKNIEDICKTLNYVLDCGSQRLRWYIDTGEERYMDECKLYLDVANIYMVEISNETT